MPCHFLTLEYSSRSLILTDRPRCSMCQRITVCSILHAKIMSFNYACKSLTYCFSNNINEFSFFKVANCNLFTGFNLLSFIIIKLKLMKLSSWINITFGVLTLSGFVCFRFSLTSCYLNCFIAINL